jgi:hypothetical protein
MMGNSVPLLQSRICREMGSRNSGIFHTGHRQLARDTRSEMHGPGIPIQIGQCHQRRTSSSRLPYAGLYLHVVGQW